MLASPGWRGGVSQRGAITAFTVGAAAGGVPPALALMTVGMLVAPVPGVVRVGALLCVAALAVARDLGLVRVALPERRRLIPHEVFLAHPWRAAARFGFELGTGVRTYVPSSAPYVLAAALLLLRPGVWTAASAGAAFGLGRSAIVWMRLAAPDPSRWDARLARRCALPALFGSSARPQGGRRSRPRFSSRADATEGTRGRNGQNTRM
ncbi:MAG: hypothetical protein ACRD0K_04105 [Egibacteraceae bacterium]